MSLCEGDGLEEYFKISSAIIFKSSVLLDQYRMPQLISFSKDSENIDMGMSKSSANGAKF